MDWLRGINNMFPNIQKNATISEVLLIESPVSESWKYQHCLLVVFTTVGHI